MIIIDFFCGSKSISKVAEAQGHSVFTIDIDKKCNPALWIDILKFDVSMLPEEFKEPDLAWFSPPCIQYSHAKRTGKRDLEAANKLVQKCFEIIEELQPKKWIIENPQTGLLKSQEIMQGIDFTDVSYCKYGLPYRKQTRLWNNIRGLTLKTCKRDCQFMSEDKKRHLGSVGNYRKKYAPKTLLPRERYALPKALCEEILKKLNRGEGQFLQ